MDTIDALAAHDKKIRVIKAVGSDTLDQRRAQLLKDISHLQAQMGRMREDLSKVYAEVVHLTVK